MALTLKDELQVIELYDAGLDPAPQIISKGGMFSASNYFGTVDNPNLGGKLVFDSANFDYIGLGSDVVIGDNDYFEVEFMSQDAFVYLFGNDTIDNYCVYNLANTRIQLRQDDLTVVQWIDPAIDFNIKKTLRIDNDGTNWRLYVDGVFIGNGSIVKSSDITINQVNKRTSLATERDCDYYKFDLKGFRLNLNEAVGQYTYALGSKKTGDKLVFNSVNGDYIDIDDKKSVAKTDDINLSIEFSFPDIAGVNQALMTKSQDVFAAGTRYLYVRRNGINQIQVNLSDLGSNNETVTTSIVNPNERAVLRVKNREVYLDEVLQGTFSSFDLNIQTTDAQLRVGRNTTATWYLDGSINKFMYQSETFNLTEGTGGTIKGDKGTEGVINTSHAGVNYIDNEMWSIIATGLFGKIKTQAATYLEYINNSIRKLIIP